MDIKMFFVFFCLAWINELRILDTSKCPDRSDLDLTSGSYLSAQFIGFKWTPASDYVSSALLFLLLFSSHLLSQKSAGSFMSHLHILVLGVSSCDPAIEPHPSLVTSVFPPESPALLESFHGESVWDKQESVDLHLFCLNWSTNCMSPPELVVPDVYILILSLFKSVFVVKMNRRDKHFYFQKCVEFLWSGSREVNKKYRCMFPLAFNHILLDILNACYECFEQLILHSKPMIHLIKSAVVQ